MYDPDLDCYDYYEPMIVTANLSDGFILESSASNGPGMNYPAQLMDGSNHLQMRNDSEMQDAVEAIFENGLQGTFFITPFR